MRKKILGSIAAFAAGAASALAQGPGVPPPAPIGPGGGAMPAAMEAMPGGMPYGGTGGPGMGGPGMGGPGMPGAGMGDPNGGMPGYPAGPHGQQSWTPPFSDPAGVNGRFAPRAWVTFDYLLGFSKSQNAAFPFVTTSAPLAGGVLGNTSTLVLHSRTDLGTDVTNGGRITAGFWRDEARRYGYYMSGFFTEYKSNVFATGSDSTGQPLLARPFVNAATGNPDVLLVSFPTFLSGRVQVEAGTQVFGAEGGPIINLYRSCPDEMCLWNVNLLTGFRYLGLHERLNIDQSSTLVGNSTAVFDGKLYGAGAVIGVSDRFDAHNNFYGGQLGLNTELRMNNWYVNATGKVAIGVVNQRLDIDGTSTLTGAGKSEVSVIRAGLYANATNNGRYSQDKFAVVPEVGVNLGYTWRSWLTTSVGYNFLYINSVVRPSEQYSTTINPAVVPLSSGYGANNGVTTPNPAGNTTDFFFHSINFTVAVRY